MFLPSRSGAASSRKRTTNNRSTAVSSKDILLRAQIERETRQRIQTEKKAALILQKHSRLFLFRIKCYKQIISGTCAGGGSVYLREGFKLLPNEQWILKFEQFFKWPYLKAVVEHMDFLAHLDLLFSVFTMSSLDLKIESVVEVITIIYDSINTNFFKNDDNSYPQVLHDALQADPEKFIKSIDAIFTSGDLLVTTKCGDGEARHKYHTMLNHYFFNTLASSETLFFGFLFKCKFARFFNYKGPFDLNKHNFKVLNFKRNTLQYAIQKGCNGILHYSDSFSNASCENLLFLLSNQMILYPDIKSSFISVLNSLLEVASFEELYAFTCSITLDKELIRQLSAPGVVSQVFLLIKVIFERHAALFKISPINSCIIFNCFAFMYLLAPTKIHFLVDRDVLRNYESITNIDFKGMELGQTFDQYKFFYFLKNTSEITEELANDLSSYYDFFQRSYCFSDYESIISQKSVNWQIEFNILYRAESHISAFPLCFQTLTDMSDEETIDYIIDKYKSKILSQENVSSLVSIFFSSFEVRKSIWKKLLAESYKDPMNVDILLKVDRNNFFNDVMYHLNGNSGSSFAVEYKGEEGRGYGLKKEFLSETSKLFFYDLNLFSVSANGDGLIPNKDFLHNSILENLGVPETNFTNTQLVKNAGKILGFLLLEGFTIPYKFSFSFWKKFLLTLYSADEKIHENEFLDLQFEDEELYSNLMMLFSLNAEDISSLGLFMEYEGVELVVNGSETPVTYDNLHLYIKLVTDFKLNNKGIENFMKAFVNGFKLVIPDELQLKVLSSFIFDSGKEITQIVNGDSLVNFPLADFISSIQLQGYTRADKTIEDLFYLLENEFSNEQLVKFFHFITSLRAPPFNGFRSLNPTICVTKITDPDFIDSKQHLPTSSTCFNLLRLPDYQDRETLMEKLSIAIEDKSGFNLA